MKTINTILGFFLFVYLISSCASISDVTDDDVYVSKNPSLSYGDEINDESSYENYRYKKAKNNLNSVYGRTNEFKLANVYIRSMVYSPSYDYHYYNGYINNNFHNGFYFGNSYYNSSYSYNNFGGYYSNDFYGYNMYGNNFYNQYYYNNSYINSNSSNQQNLSNINYIQGPRNSISGINAGRRMGSSFTGKKGLALNTGNSTTAYSGATVNGGKRTSDQTINNTTEIKTESKNTNRKTVTSGTGLAKNGVRVSSNNISSVRREVANTHTSTPVTMGNNGTTRNSGGNSGTTVKTGTTTRSGGNTGGSTGGTTGKRKN